MILKALHVKAHKIPVLKVTGLNPVGVTEDKTLICVFLP
jgi:hypothetical protein